jgi:hypothetical protein
MTFRIGECSSCGATYKLPASFAADQARCKNCGGVVQIGKAGASAPLKPAPPVPATRPAGATAVRAPAQPPAKKKHEGPSMKERLLAQRQAAGATHGAAAKPSPPVDRTHGAKSVKSTTYTPAAKGTSKAASPRAGTAIAAAAPVEPGPGASPQAKPAGSRTRSSRRGASEASEDGGRAGGRRHAPKKKEPPILGFIAAVVLLVGISGGAYWYLTQEPGPDAAAAPETKVAMAADATQDSPSGSSGEGASSVEDVTSGAEDGADGGQAPIAAAADEAAAAAKPKPVKAPPGDPASVDLSLIPQYGPIAGCSPARFAELEELAATMVDPEAGAAGNRAKLALLESGKEAFPVIFNALKAQDLTSEDGFRNADACQRALQELCNGRNFGWKYESQEPDTFHYFDKKVIVSWSKAWEQAKDNDGAWAKLAKLDQVEGAAPAAEETKKAADEATEDALDKLDDL